MARSNRPAPVSDQAAGWPHQEVDAQGRPLDAGARWPAQPQGYAQPPHQQPHYQPGYPQQGQAPVYADPYPPQQAAQPPGGYGYAQGEPQPGYAPDPYAQQPRSGIPPQFERFVPQPAAPGGYDRQEPQFTADPRYAEPTAPPQGGPYQDQYAPHYAGQHPDPHAAQQGGPFQGQPAGGYPGHYAGQPGDPYAGQYAGQQPGPYPGHHPGQGAPIGHEPAPTDMRGWDLSQYPPPGQPGYGAPDPHGYAARDGGQGRLDPHWPAPQQGWPPGGGAHDPHGYAPGGPEGPPLGHQHDYAGQPGDPHGYAHEAQYAEEPQDDEDTGERRRPGALVVVGALVAAIALGGGLAFAYKMFGPTKTAMKPPVVKADKSPPKIKPATPGGKDVAHTDKRFLNRLADDKPEAAPAPTAEKDAGGPRRVPTMIVNRDGSIIPTAQPAPAAPPAPTPPSTGVPGMIVQGGPPPPRPAPQAPEPRPIAAQPAPEPIAKPPRVADLPLPKVDPAPARKRPAPRDDALARQQPAAATPVAVPKGGSNGYVAVLTSRKSRDDALKSFADLHQKYGQALNGRVPDVREVNLGEKGVWYRLIVGPPGSREAASTLCKQLKDLGHAGCFQMAY